MKFNFARVWKFRLAMMAAVLNIAGAGLLYWSFQATSTDLLLVTGSQMNGFCVAGHVMFAMAPDGKGLLMGGGVDCPEGPAAKRTAVVNTEHPSFNSLGWFLIILGFVLQLLSLEYPEPPTLVHTSYGPRQRSAKHG
jgi:hypothetical protein